MINPESYYRTEYEPGGRTPEYLIILCRRGHIGHWSDTHMVCALDMNSNKTRDRLRELGGRLVQDGDDGQNWILPWSVLPAVCRAMGARRKRTLSPEHRAKLIQAGSKSRFKKRSDRSADKRS